MKDVIKRNLDKRYLVCLFSKFVRYFLKQVQFYPRTTKKFQFADESIAE